MASISTSRLSRIATVSADTLQPGALIDLIDDVQDVNVRAAPAGTNAYEILTTLGPCYRRQYLNDPHA